MEPRQARQLPTLVEELALWQAGHVSVAGIDEAGRGAWAGPVVAAAVILPVDPAIACRLAGVADSKQLSVGQRERLYAVIVQEAVAWAVGATSAAQIDVQGIAAATRSAMQAAVASLLPLPDFMLIDYIRLPGLATPQRSLPKGDSKVLSIAAASIVAKVTRDRLMVELGACYPGYGFERHKGYGTAQHQRSLRQLGPCLEHRMSFQPVAGVQLALFGVEDRHA
ncbi:MAG TPA: ribonuclease HII [Anaerolineae bacterium]|nr:ribonuclease HII [Anaerolineae bacterium]